MTGDRFWTKVAVGSPDQCWPWLACKDRKGYGRFRVSLKANSKFAHRLSFEEANGPIPTGLFVMHTCDNPSCVNPAHLRLGTNADNMRDCAEKGRNHRGGPKRRGESLPQSKFTAEQVIQVRRDYIAGVPLWDIAAKNAVTHTLVQDVCYGRTWRHLFHVPGAPTLEQLQAAKRSAPPNS